LFDYTTIPIAAVLATPRGGCPADSVRSRHQRCPRAL